jgi:DME family drug/metabolite transporter
MSGTELAVAAIPAGARVDLVYLRSALLVVLAGSLWSTGGVLVKLVEAADARQIVLYRSLFVALTVGAVLAWRTRGTLLPSFRAVGWNGALGGLCLAGAFIFFIEALTRTTVANALFILAVQPFLAALFARLILGEAVHGTTWLAMLAALAGIGVMMAPGLALGSASGSLMALVSAVCFALFSVTLRRGRHLDSTPCLLYATLFSGLICGLLLVASRGPGALLIGGHDLLACAAMGVVQIGCGMLAFTAGSRHLPAADLALLALTEVVLGPVWAWLVVGEVPAFWTLVGGAIVLSATAVQAVVGARRLAGSMPENSMIHQPRA